MDKNYSTINYDPTDSLENILIKGESTTIPPRSSLTTTNNTTLVEITDKINRFKLEFGKPIKLIILTPCYGGITHVNYMICLINTIELFKNVGISLHIEFCKNDSLITRARNNLIAVGMNIPDATHFMFIDNDITWNPIEIIKLLISNKDVVGGVYPLKSYKWDKLLNMEDDSITNIINKKRENNEVLKYFDNETILKSQLLKYNMNVYNAELKIENNITEIRHLPTGFMMLKREVIEQMSTVYKDTKYCDDIGFLNRDQDKYAYALFDTGILDGHYLSEDWLFCERWTKIGGKIHMDVSILLTHTGMEDYTGCFILSV
jgi:hypothetical protein